MAVQKKRKTRSRRDMRRPHDALTSGCLSTDDTTGEIRRRHHLTPNGYYKGEQVVEFVKKERAEDE